MVIRLWGLFYEMKYNEYYYELYRKHAQLVDGIMSGSIIGLSVIPIALWDYLQGNRVLWGVIIVASQLLQIGKSLLPMSKRLTGLMHLIPEMRLLAIDAQYAYEKYKDASDDEILEVIVKIRRRHTELDNKYLADDLLPPKKGIQDSACIQCDRYMELYEYKSIEGGVANASEVAQGTRSNATPNDNEFNRKSEEQRSTAASTHSTT